MIETLWCRVHVEGVGWTEYKTDWDQEKVSKKGNIIAIGGIGEGFRYNQNQFSEMNEALKRIGIVILEAWEAVLKGFQPTIEYLNQTIFNSFDFYSSTEKKKIYQADYRMKSNAKNYSYVSNYRGRMFCVGNRGNFRRF